VWGCRTKVRGITLAFPTLLTTRRPVSLRGPIRTDHHMDIPVAPLAPKVRACLSACSRLSCTFLVIFNCSHVHLWIVFFNTLLYSELLLLCLCWLVWSILIGCVCGRGPVVVSGVCGSVRYSLAGLPLTVSPIYLFVLHSYKEQMCATFCEYWLSFTVLICVVVFFWYFFEAFRGVRVHLTKLFVACL